MTLMNNMEIGHFINGLRVFLKSSEMTQEEFAQGVTSKVNMSNILRGNSGTSEKMRRALAKKAGLSVEDLVSLGKSKSPDDEVVPTTAVRMKNGFLPDVSHDAIASMSALEIMNQTAELKNHMLEAVVNHNKQLTSFISALTKQRDDLMVMLDEHKASVNVLEQPIITLNRKKVIQDCNRVACESLGVFPGNAYTEAHEEVERVFLTGRKEYLKIGEVQAAVYPVLDQTGNVKRVVVMLRSLNTNQDYPMGTK